MTYVVQSSGYGYFSSSALVALVLNHPSTASAYRLYQTLEIMASPHPYQATNKRLSATTSLSESTISKALAFLQRLHLVKLEYPDDKNSAERTIVCYRQLSGEAISALEARAAELRIDLGALYSAAIPASSTMPTPVSIEPAFPIKALSVSDNTKSTDVTDYTTPKEKVEKEKGDAADAACAVPPEQSVRTLAQELITLSGSDREVTQRDLSLLEARLSAGFTDAMLRTAVAKARELPGWQAKRVRRLQCDPQIVLETPELINRILDGEVVHPIGCTAPKARQLAVQRVFQEWRRAMGYGAEHVLTAKQFGCINARLEEGFTVEQLVNIAKWIAPQPFYRGQNERNRPFDDPCSIWRSKDRVLQHLRSIGRPGHVDRRFQHLAASDAPVEAERY